MRLSHEGMDSKPTKYDKAGEVFFLWAQLEREQAVGHIAETILDPADLEAWHTEAVAALTTLDRVKQTYLAFRADPYWRERRSKWAMFRKHWREFTPPAESALPPVPTCKTCGTTERLNGGWCVPCVASFQESAKAEPVAA
jgi:hypothetical protein